MGRQADSWIRRFLHFFTLFLRGLVRGIQALLKLLLGLFRLLDFLGLGRSTRGRTTGDIQAATT